MPLATRRLAGSRRSITLIAAAAVAAGAVAGTGAGAQAQTETPAHKAAPKPAPAKKPAPAAQAAPAASPAPAAPAAAGATPAQPGAGPQIVQVKSEPSQADWTKMCGKGDQNAPTEICFTTRDFVSDKGQPVLAVAVYDVKNGPAGQPNKMVRFLMPLGLMLRPGIRFAVDQGQPNAGQYSMCLPNGCFAEGPVKDDFVASLRKGTTLNVTAQNPATGSEVTFAVPADGFGKAFDGPAMDPKVIEEQQKKMQSELEKRSEEMRKKLEQSAAPGATSSTPAAGSTGSTAAAPK